MTGVKPYTTDRQFPGDAEVTVSAEADNWYRTWASGDKLVVIADRPEAVRVTAPGYETVAIALPE